MAERRTDRLPSGSTDRIFGGTTTFHASNEHAARDLEEYWRVEEDLAQLQSIEMRMWLTRHPRDDLNSWALFKEIEEKTQSVTATEDDRAQLQLLKDLREKKSVMANFHYHSSQGHFLETKNIPSMGDATPQPSSVDGSRFWAVVVGINAYDTLNNLSGACPDAIAVYQYLISDLSVPHQHVRLLLSEAFTQKYPDFQRATRENILSALYEHLRDNPDIRRGDNVLFYFAGQGSRYSSESVSQPTDETIEALCPADRGLDSPQGPVLDISDREISIFLEELRDEKGDNITVIFDCCYSQPADRIRGDRLQSARGAKPLAVSVERLLRTVDSDVRRKSGSRLAFSANWEWDPTTCVLLTACLSDELAREAKFEDAWHGYFTRALLAMLKLDIGRTYAGLCDAITEYMPKFQDTYTQTPLVVGAKEDCRMWYIPDVSNHQPAVNLPHSIKGWYYPVLFLQYLISKCANAFG